MEYDGIKFLCNGPGLFSLSNNTWRHQDSTSLLRVLSVGICSSDYGRFFKSSGHLYPLTPGHEIYAKVEHPGIKSNTKSGDYVSVFPLLPCNECIFCSSTEYQLCENYSYYGSRQDGGLSSYMNAESWNLKKHELPLPNHLGNQVEPLGVVLHAFNRLTAYPEVNDLVIVGGGFLTYLAIFVAKARGITRVSVITSSNLRRKFFANFAETINPTKESNQKFQAAIDFSGNSDNLNIALGMLKKKSQIVLAANSRPDTSISSYAWDKIIRGEIRVVGTWNSTYLGPDSTDDWCESIRLLSSKEIPNLYPHDVIELRELKNYLINQQNVRSGNLTDKILPRLSVNINDH